MPSRKKAVSTPKKGRTPKKVTGFHSAFLALWVLRKLAEQESSSETLRFWVEDFFIEKKEGLWMVWKECGSEEINSDVSVFMTRLIRSNEWDAFYAAAYRQLALRQQ